MDAPLQHFIPLAAAALFWFLIHPVIAGSSLRTTIVHRIGEQRFRGFFALVSIAALTWLLLEYRATGCKPLWTTPKPFYFLPLVAVPLALVLLFGSFTVRNPTRVWGEKALAVPEPARGVLRITRHPFLWSVALWASAHLIVNGNVPAVLVFGSFLATALVGTRDIDRKRAADSACAEDWRRYVAVTSNVPFVAIFSGRNRLMLRELWIPLALAAIASAAIIHFHTPLFGLSALRALN